MFRLLKISALAFLIFPSGFAFSQWSPVGAGVNSYVICLTADTNNNYVYAGGQFDTAGGIPANYIAKWDGTNWDSLGSGTSWGVLTECLASTNDLYVGGAFLQAGGNTVNFITKWDYVNWSALSSGLDNAAQSVVEYNGEIYAAGYILFAGGNPVNRIAKWDGTSWQPVGAGTDAPIRCMVVYNGELYVGGVFQNAGGVPATGIAKWNGTSWSDVGGGVWAPDVWTMCVYNGELYVGGSFTWAAGTSIIVNNIAKWNGSAWSALGTGAGVVGMPRSMDVMNNALYVGGNYSTIDGVPCNYIAKWNGSFFAPLGSGTDASVEALTSLGNTLYAGGNFAVAGGIPASWIAQWTEPTSIEEENVLNNISVFPSISNGIINIKIEKPMDVQFSIYSILGEKIKSGILTKSEEVNLAEFPDGMYLINVFSKNKTRTQKIILIH